MHKTRFYRNRYLLISLLLLCFALFYPNHYNNLAFKESDKMIHVVIFLLVSLNLFYFFRRSNDRIVILLAFIGFGFLSEFIQSFIPGRFMDMRDGLANGIGICLAYLLFRIAPDTLDYLFKLLRA